MAVYRFRISFEDYDEVIREVDMSSKSTFQELHFMIQQANGYPPDVPSSFYKSNDQWKKGQEIAFQPSDAKLARGVIEMKSAKLNQYINDPHQKFYYTYDFNRPVDFHVQLIKITREDPEKTYPSVFRSVGVSPKLFNTGSVPSGDSKESETFDLFNEMDYEEDDADQMNLDNEGQELRNDEYPGDFDEDL